MHATTTQHHLSKTTAIALLRLGRVGNVLRFASGSDGAQIEWRKQRSSLHSRLFIYRSMVLYPNGTASSPCWLTSQEAVHILRRVHPWPLPAWEEGGI
jgi:hypothetical protein